MTNESDTYTAKTDEQQAASDLSVHVDDARGLINELRESPDKDRLQELLNNAADAIWDINEVINPQK